MIWKNSVITKNKIKALKPLYTNDFRALLWQGQKDLKLPLRNIVALLAWSARTAPCFFTSPPRLPPPQAAAQRFAPARSARLGFIQFNPNKTKKTPEGVFLLWQGQKDLNPRHAVLETAALPTELYPYEWWATRDSNPGPFGYEPSALTN